MNRMIYLWMLCILVIAGWIGAYAEDKDQDVSKLSNSELIKIISDPLLQRNEEMLVSKALKVLSERKPVKAIDPLVDMIAYPLYIHRSVSNGMILKSGGSSYGTMTSGPSIYIHFFPAAGALVSIGEPAIPAVLKKLAKRNRLERIACIDVLIELKTRNEVEELIKKELASAKTAEEKSNLKESLEVLLPGARQSESTAKYR